MIAGSSIVVSMGSKPSPYPPSSPPSPPSPPSTSGRYGWMISLCVSSLLSNTLLRGREGERERRRKDEGEGDTFLLLLFLELLLNQVLQERRVADFRGERGETRRGEGGQALLGRLLNHYITIINKRIL